MPQISTSTYPKPIIKWVGGKTQILDKLIVDFPKTINSYHEIFLGGGSVLFAFLLEVKKKNIEVKNKINAYELNEPLINMYINIQTNHTALYDKLNELIIDYNNCPEVKINPSRAPKNIEEAKTSKESYYYWIRSCFNKLSHADKNKIIGSAMFIFLNKTCFRGLFRLNRKGENNTPYGNYKSPKIINKQHLNEIHELIQNVNFKYSSFEESLDNVEEGDFAYLDPPYAPESETSFVKYTVHGFDLEMHKKLFMKCNEIADQNDNNNKKIKFMLNNADVPLIKKYFTPPKFSINTIICKRTINAKKPDSETREVIIKNY